MTKLLLTVPEAVAALGISRSKLYQLISAGTIRSVRIDGSRRVPKWVGGFATEAEASTSTAATSR